jgi:hypothetical protein
MTPADAALAYANRFKGRLVNDEGLEGVFARTKEQPTLSVDRRAASVELRTINDVLVNGYNGRQVAQVRVLPPTNVQRTPDLALTFSDGSTTRIEIRTFTSAPRGHSEPHAPLAQATRTRADPLTQSAIEAAIASKAASTPTRFSQLDVPLAGVSPGGRIALGATHQRFSTATADAAVMHVAPRLGSYVHSISLMFVDDITGKRTTLVYNRQGTTFVR